ncbi:unnamed protein product [Schistocephalus solidus]|uniref:Creatinase_N domain-containing protein n=1 Tax=Schistocephalus solidus TaxID=70667 RepID=A0A183SGP3_SCHSO|nr:unnamed protein product [Schistocephalus solidus]
MNFREYENIKDVVALLTDEGHSTVIVGKDMYWTKLDKLSVDRDSFEPLAASDFGERVKAMHKSIGKFWSTGTLTSRKALATEAADIAVARFYGLSKYTNLECPFAPLPLYMAAQPLVYQSGCTKNCLPRQVLKAIGEF